jgi:hypothetical protein
MELCMYGIVNVWKCESYADCQSALYEKVVNSQTRLPTGGYGYWLSTAGELVPYSARPCQTVHSGSDPGK